LKLQPRRWQNRIGIGIGKEGLSTSTYLDFFRFRCRKVLDEIFDLFSLHHEVVHELLFVRCWKKGVCFM